MRRDMLPDDGVTLTLGGVTHRFPASRVRISVDDTTTRSGGAHRFATVIVDLSGGEFPEDLAAHLNRLKGG